MGITGVEGEEQLIATRKVSKAFLKNYVRVIQVSASKQVSFR